MQLTYRYRLYPSRMQEHRLLVTLDQCRWLYNHFLQQLNQGITNHQTPHRYELQAMLPKLKIEHPELKQVHSKVLQMVLHRLYSNLSTLDGLRRNGHKVGKLRFKKKGWFKSFTYNQSGFRIVEDCGKRRRLWLSKIGTIPMMVHRELDSEIKQVHIKHERSGKWFACFSVEVNASPRAEKLSKPVGIDLGIIHYAADTNGDFVRHPHNLIKLERKLRREQRKFSRRQNGSENWTKQRIKLARVHERVRNRRFDFLHKLSRYYINKHDFIAVEDLRIKELMESVHNGKNITDSAWSNFLYMLTYKAERAGRLVVSVNARGTTSRCSSCGKSIKKPLSVRVHECPECGLKLDRDLNAALNILRRGLRQVGWEPTEFTPVEIGPLPARACPIVEAGSPNLTVGQFTYP